MRETVSEPMLGQIRLQWWRESIAAAFDGGPVRHHIVVEALTAVIRACALTRAHFDRLVDAREGDLGEVPWTSLAALEDYAEATSARLLYLALESLGVREPAANKAAFHIGIAYGLAGLLRAMPFQARAGRLIIPNDIAEQTQLDANDYRALRSTPALQVATEAIVAAASAAPCVGACPPRLDSASSTSGAVAGDRRRALADTTETGRLRPVRTDARCPGPDAELAARHFLAPQPDLAETLSN